MRDEPLTSFIFCFRSVNLFRKEIQINASFSSFPQPILLNYQLRCNFDAASMQLRCKFDVTRIDGEFLNMHGDITNKLSKNCIPGLPFFLQ